MPLEPLNLQVS